MTDGLGAVAAPSQTASVPADEVSIVRFEPPGAAILAVPEAGSHRLESAASTARAITAHAGVALVAGSRRCAPARAFRLPRPTPPLHYRARRVAFPSTTTHSGSPHTTLLRDALLPAPGPPTFRHLPMRMHPPAHNLALGPTALAPPIAALLLLTVEVALLGCYRLCTKSG
jgi:hypothetical protein